MAELRAALAIGRRDPQPSDPHQAQQLYRQALRADPDNADALSRLGAACLMLGQFSEAATNFQQALRLRPHQAEGHKNLGIALARQGNLAEAVASFQEALRLKPDLADVQLNLGNALREQGRLDEAVARYQQALRLEPDSPEAHHNLGIALERQGRPDEAVTCYQQALRLKPDDAEVQNDLGIVLARRGRLDEAAARFQQVIRLKPNYPDAYNNLGNILEKQDKLDEALACYQRALRLKPNYPEAHYNLGIVMGRQDKLDEAVASYQQALQLRPNYPEAHNNLGTVLARQGKLDEAVASYRQALQLKPADPEAHNNLGLALARQGKLDEAVASYQESLRLKPNYPEAHSNLGNALQEQGRLDEAVASCQQALRLKPDSAEAHHNLGIVLAKQDKLDEAMASFQQTLRLKPDYPEAHHNLGIVLGKQDKLDEAMASFQQTLRLKPDYPDAHNNLGLVLGRQGRLDEAVACYQQAVQLKPDYPEAHWNLALGWLQMGRFEQGWAGYEWRWKCKEFGSLPPFQPPLWDGSSLDGRTILVHAEQGLGDTLQFIRYVPSLHQRGGRVILMCQPPLVRLLTRSPGIERLLAHGDPVPEFDVHTPLLSLPRLLGTTLESVPADVPYLDAEPQLVEAWRHRLGSYPGFKVGIVWQGNPKFRLDRLRSAPLTEFAPLARVPGVHLFSLQKGPGAEQLAPLTDRFPVTDLGSNLDDFVDAAAVLKNLDLVISVDTAIAHLAGALGIPVWVALPFAPDWRWLMGREDSPWYPTMRLFRQDRAGDWAGVFAEIRVATEKMAAEKRKQGMGGKTPGTRGTRSPASRPGQEAQTPGVVPDPMRGDSRLLLDQGHVRVKHCRYGPMAYLATDQYVGQSLDRYGEFSEGEVELFRQVIRPGWTVVEIGADMGAHTVFLAKATGSLGRVLALEPQRVIFQILCANLALNGLSHVEAFHAAAGREPGTITVPRLDYTARQNFGGVSLGSHAAGEAVQQMTIDGLKLPACHLLKIDVEGMEGEVLAGAEQTIRRWRPVLYVENDRPEKSAELIRQALGLGYRLYWHLPRLFNPHNYFGVTENIFGTIVSANMLGFHTSVSQNMTDLREITDPEDDWKTRC